MEVQKFLLDWIRWFLTTNSKFVQCFIYRRLVVGYLIETLRFCVVNLVRSWIRKLNYQLINITRAFFIGFFCQPSSFTFFILLLQTKGKYCWYKRIWTNLSVHNSKKVLLWWTFSILTVCSSTHIVLMLNFQLQDFFVFEVLLV